MSENLCEYRTRQDTLADLINVHRSTFDSLLHTVDHVFIGLLEKPSFCRRAKAARWECGKEKGVFLDL